MSVTIHNKEDFSKMRIAGRLAAEILDYIGDFVKIGVTTNELNQLCHDKIIENNAIPAPLNYKGFPKSICTSINQVICHGIPDDKKLKNGDIINIDVTVIVDGWHGDTSRMYYVGKTAIKDKRLCSTTYEAMMLGIEQVKPGATLGDIGFAIQNYAEKAGYSVVRDFCGHGIGKIFHSEPNVLHYGKPNSGLVLKEGMFFTIEPMINEGRKETKMYKAKNNSLEEQQKAQWVAITTDQTMGQKSRSAQFEHTIGVTADGYEIFTKSLKNLDFPQ